MQPEKTHYAVLPDPDRKHSTPFDEFMIGMCVVAARMNAGMPVCSGDVRLLFNPLRIDFFQPGRGGAVHQCSGGDRTEPLHVPQG